MIRQIFLVLGLFLAAQSSIAMTECSSHEKLQDGSPKYRIQHFKVGERVSNVNGREVRNKFENLVFIDTAKEKQGNYRPFIDDLCTSSVNGYGRTVTCESGVGSSSYLLIQSTGTGAYQEGLRKLFNLKCI